jgi:hypothetical protein
MHLQECGGEERGRNTCTHVLARLASSGWAGRAMLWLGVAKGAGVGHAREWSAEFWHKASLV